MAQVRVIGLGQAAAGDDGIGLRVLERLQARFGPRPDLEFLQVRDTAELVEWLADAPQVWIVDAVVVTEPSQVGQVEVFSLDQLREARLRAVSTHGVGLEQAIELSRALGSNATPEVRVIGVGILPPRRYGYSLSPELESAIDRAVRMVGSMLGEPRDR